MGSIRRDDEPSEHVANVELVLIRFTLEKVGAVPEEDVQYRGRNPEIINPARGYSLKVVQYRGGAIPSVL